MVITDAVSHGKVIFADHGENYISDLFCKTLIAES